MPLPIEDAAVYAFADCTVDVPKHELRVGGDVRKVAPRVFDLLVYLIEHRARVVPMDELLDRVWRGTCLSPGVIARAVMQARDALGDKVATPRFISNVHRVGYRFIAPVATSGSGAAPPRPDALPTPAPRPAMPDEEKPRVAVLPLVNATGDPQLAWVELGLLSLLNQSLRADQRIRLASMATVLNAVDAADPTGDGRGDRVGALQRLIGDCWVCEAAISRHAGGFALDYSVASPMGRVDGGRLEGAEPTGLCRDLAQAIDVCLFGGAAVRMRFLSADHLANQAFARAVQAREQRHAESALKFIRVVLDLEPESLAARLEHLHILCLLLDPAMHALGEQLLAEAVARGDAATATQVHLLLAHAIRQQEGLGARAQHHCGEAWRLTGPGRSEDWALRVYHGCAGQAMQLGDAERARLLFDHAENACERAGDRLAQSLLLINRGGLEASEGNLLTARGMWDRALTAFQGLGQSVYALTTRLNLSTVNAALGLPEASLAHADEATALFATFQRYDDRDDDLAALCIRYAEAGRLASIERLIGLMPAAGAETGTGLTASRQVAEAQRQACLGHLGSAGELLLRAIRIAIDTEVPWNARQWAPLWLHNEMRAGRHEPAHAQAVEWLTLAPLATCHDLIGMALHARALHLHAQGDVDAARQQLTEALAMMLPGRWMALVRLDAAWLDIERSNIERAATLLSAAHAWPQKHPIGLLVQARWSLASGSRSRAAESMALSLSLRPSRAPEVLWLASKIQAEAGSASASRPGHRLPSVW